MVKNRIRMRHLRCFLAVARTGSITGAANELGVVQPSVSRSIRELEETLNKTLFERTPKGVLLNVEGKIFFSHISDGLGQIDTGLNAMHSLAEGRRVVAYVLPNVVRTIMPEATMRFKSLFPAVDLVMPVTKGGGWQQLLVNGEADFAFGRLLTAEQMSGINFEHLFDEALTFFVRAGHPLADAGEISVDDIDGFPVILPLPDTIIRNEMDRFLISKGKPRFRNTIETLSFEFARSFLTATDAVVWLPLGAMQRECAAGTVRRLNLDAPELVAAVGLSSSTGRRVNASAKVLMQIIRDVVLDRKSQGELI